MEKPTKESVEKLLSDLIKKHDLTMNGETLYPDIYTFGETEIVFEDEYIGYLLAGYVSSKVFNELDCKLLDLGIEMIDSDGCKMIIETKAA